MPGTEELDQGDWSWEADFDGPGLIFCWGGGASGASGQAVTRGGDGGQGGYLCVDLQEFVSGVTYTGFNGAGGAEVDWLGGGGNPSNPGQDSFFGGGTTCYAPGGGSGSVPIGRARIPGLLGESPVSPDWIGGDGGAAPTQGAYEGGAGGINNAQGEGTAGSIPGGGGSGGGQSGAGNGAAGASGGCIIIPATDESLPGYYLIGVDAEYNFSGAGPYDDFQPQGDGLAYFEAVGSGGGGKGGNSFAAQGSHGASGGAWMYRLREVFKDVQYRRVIPVGGIGSDSNFGAPTNGTNGADAEWTVTPLRVISKRLTNNIAWLTTYAPAETEAQRHGFLLGESMVVAGVDGTFNGTYTVARVDSAADWNSATAYVSGNRVNMSGGLTYEALAASTNKNPVTEPTFWALTKPDRLAVGYTKTAANVGQTAVTPAGTSVGLSLPFLRAKGGLGAVGVYTGGTPVAGGQVSAGIGDGGINGDRGQATQLTTPPNSRGGNAGGGALPLGELGGWGGGFVLAAGSEGDPGQVPGGGGGGGRGNIGGHGGDGARGAAVVRWVLELNGIWVGGERKSVTRVKIWDGGVANEAIQAKVWDGGVARNTNRVLTHPESLRRRFPAYLKGTYDGVDYDYTAFYDRDTAAFNWKAGVGQRLLTPLNAGDFDLAVFGDSVSEGWTSYDGLLTGIKNFPKAFPRVGRDMLVGDVPGLAKGGTGLTRPNTVSGQDPQWTFAGGWSQTGDKHYVTGSALAAVATFTPALDSEGVQLTGNKGAVVYSGGGITVKNASNVVIATGAPTAGFETLARLEFNFASTAGHVVKVSPAVADVEVRLFGADIYKTGFRLHNMSQGGSKAGGGTGQTYWGPATGMVAPTNMTACYTQDVLAPASKGGQSDAFLIFLGGNDSNAGSDAATIRAAIKRMTDMIRAAAPDAPIILMPDVWTADRTVALMDLCLDDDLAMIDFYYLSRALTAIFGQNYNGDAFGHLNAVRTDGGVPGSTWAGDMVRDAFLLDTN